MVNIFNRTSDPADADKQRLHKSEVLLTQLYRKEVGPRFRVPDMPGVRFLAYFSVLAVVLFFGTLFYKFNAFIVLREAAMSKQGTLQSYIQRRSNLFANLINLTINHASLEHSIFVETAKMRTEIIKKSDPSPKVVKELMAKYGIGGKGGGALPSDWSKALEVLQGGGSGAASLGRLSAVVEQYPNIQSSKTYHLAMTSLVEMEDMIAARRTEYNETLRKYNTAISKFPWDILADWTHFKRLDYFAAKTPVDGAPIINKSMFKQLMSVDGESK